MATRKAAKREALKAGTDKHFGWRDAKRKSQENDVSGTLMKHSNVLSAKIPFRYVGIVASR